MAIQEINAPIKEAEAIKNETPARPHAGRSTEWLKKKVITLREVMDGETPEENIIFMKKIIAIEEELKIRHYENPNPIANS